VDASLGVGGAALAGLGFVLDPVGSLVSMGVAWLIEHVKPLSDALDWLAGDPDQIAAYAQTWANVATRAAESGQDLATAVQREVTDWGGVAADAYRGNVGQQVTVLEGIAEAAAGIGEAVQASGELVAAVRMLVRDLIADCVALLAARLPMWTAKIAGTLGAATPIVVAEVAGLVARWARVISKFLDGLLRSLAKLGDLLATLATALARLKRALQELAELLARRFSRHGDAGPPGSTGPDGPGSGGPDGPTHQLDAGPDHIPPPTTDGPTLPTKPMPDHYRYETDPTRAPFPGQSVRRLSPEELEEHRVFVGSDGLIYKSDGSPFDTRGSDTHWGGPDSDRAIFVMDEHGNIYASTFQEAGVFHHSTLSNGGPVGGAGELHVENGMLVGITDTSGHYHPNQWMTQQVVDRFQSQGVNMDGVYVNTQGAP
jgi:uncharacterized protein YukE